LHSGQSPAKALAMINAGIKSKESRKRLFELQGNDEEEDEDDEEEEEGEEEEEENQEEVLVEVDGEEQVEKLEKGATATDKLKKRKTVEEKE
jgi:hypothetical protein